jgi:hypothetical protein
VKKKVNRPANTLLILALTLSAQFTFAEPAANYTCVVSVQAEGAADSFEIEKSKTLFAANRDSFSSTIQFEAIDGGPAVLDFTFSTSIQDGKNKNETRVVSPFDGSELSHSDITGDSTFSESILNLVEPFAMRGSRDALVAYNINILFNLKNRDVRWQGQKLSKAAAACQRGVF